MAKVTDLSPGLGQIVHEFKSKEARELVDYYLERKKKILELAEVSVNFYEQHSLSLNQGLLVKKYNKDPKFVAGMLLRAFGGLCIAKYNEAKGLGVRWHKKAGLLMRRALNAEFRADGTVHCNFCLREAEDSEDLLQWLRTYYGGRWACPACIKSQDLYNGKLVPESN